MQGLIERAFLWTREHPNVDAGLRIYVHGFYVGNKSLSNYGFMKMIDTLLNMANINLTKEESSKKIQSSSISFG